MTPKDRARVVKVLAMTTSTHDGEALAAVRLANGILKEAKTTWWEFFNLAEVGQEEDIRSMFEFIYERRCNNAFIESLYDGWRYWGSLTDKQLAALRRSYNRAMAT